ncbi:MAG TPA: c-type cytochrome [Verrucomicrobiae bacterium]
MTTTFWRQIHGGSTHFPIVLLLASVVFDFIAWRSRDEGLRRGLHAAGFGSAVVGMLGGITAGIAGLIMTRGRVLGGGYERTHHFFVWPALAACVAFVAWRLLRRGRIPARGLGVYFAGMSVAVLLMTGAGYSGGELLLSAESGSSPVLPPSSMSVSPQDRLAIAPAGRELFLKNCAHCHAADAHGDEGPDLHNLDWTDEQIATRIRNGKKGQMTAFAGKLSPEQISKVIAYLRTLK